MPWIECPGSGERQGLSWFPTDNYPGAVVCIYCTYGVLVRKRSVISGPKGDLGTVRRHYINEQLERMTYHKPKPDKYNPKHLKVN